MAESSRPRDSFQEHSPEFLLPVDAACDRFELAWLTSDRPRIGEFLEGIPPLAVATCFRHLLELDLEYRRRRGEVPRLHDYLPEFSHLRSILEELFRDAPSVSLGIDPADTEERGDRPRSIAKTAGSLSDDMPAALGRFEIRELLGKGGFGQVFRAFDPELRREVAIKVARGGRPSEAGDPELQEARVAAKLDHPAIVPVYEVGRLDDQRLMIVSRLIRGTDLRTRMREFPLGRREAVELVRTIASALQVAHAHGIFHRDLKPENILIDQDHQPFLTDFGLAMREEETGQGAQFVGTPAYMSPEQARGEGHLIDARSDLYSLAVILYELTLGRRPFTAKPQESLLREIQDGAPPAPRDIDPGFDPELERILLKGLSRQSLDRFPDAATFAEELRVWLTAEKLLIRHDADPTADASPMIPRGLRPFGAEDANFFWKLIPGPRGRGGVPEVVEDWRNKLQSRDRERTFRVGVLYGPSGSGKSSLVNAGILPALDKSIVVCSVAATPDATAQGWLRSLRRLFPALTHIADTAAAMRSLREGKSCQRGTKVLVVLDQFEQWISRGEPLERSEVAAALRQCDGTHTQALLLVRDDFWAGLTRLMRFLDLEIDAKNSRMIDTFDAPHARKVLAEIGMAYGATGDDSEDRDEFLRRVVAELAETGPLMPVRLALFADIFRQREWSTKELLRAGGTRGALSLFLDARIAGNDAHPTLRSHPRETLAILRALLPPSGSRIKDSPRTIDQLIARAGLPHVETARRILDALSHECRVVTTVAGDERDVGEPTFQLAHDHLIPIVRDWVERRERTTARGRAEILLRDRAETWSAAPTRRNLPSPWELLRIVALTQHRRWPPNARAMIKAATRTYTIWLTSAALLATMMTWSVLMGLRRSAAKSIVHRLLDANIAEVPVIVKEMANAPRDVWPQLRAAFQELDKLGPTSIDDRTPQRRLNVALGLCAIRPETAGEATNRKQPRVWPEIQAALGWGPRAMTAVPAADLPPILEILREIRQQIPPHLLTDSHASSAAVVENPLRDLAIRVAIAGDATTPFDSVPRATRSLIQAAPKDREVYRELLRPIQNDILMSLTPLYQEELSEAERQSLSAVHADFAAGNLSALLDALAWSTKDQLSASLQAVVAFPNASTARQELLRRFQLERKGSVKAPDLADTSEALRTTVEGLQGAAARHAAFVQAVPLREADQLLGRMAAEGYRPVSYRPYFTRNGVQVAVGWCRDRGAWRVDADLTAEALRKVANEAATHDLALTDVCCYATTEEDPGQVRFAATWGPRDGILSWELVVDLELDAYLTTLTRWSAESRAKQRLFLRQDPQGRPLFTSLAYSVSVGDTMSADPAHELTRDFRNFYRGFPQLDCQLNPLAPRAVDLFPATWIMARKPNLQRASLDARAMLVFYGLQLETDFDGEAGAAIVERAEELTNADPTRLFYMELFIQALCRNRAWERAERAIGTFIEAGGDLAAIPLLQLRIALARGDLAEAERTRGLIQQAADDWESAPVMLPAVSPLSTSYLKARSLAAAYERLARAASLSVAAEGPGQEPGQPDRGELLDLGCHALERFMALCDPSQSHAKLDSFARDQDFLGLRRDPRFIARLEEEGITERITAIWGGDPRIVSRLERPRLSEEHLRRSRTRLDQGYTPRSLACRELATREQVLATSVWHREAPDITRQARQSATLANLALALARRGELSPMAEILAGRLGREPRGFVFDRLPESHLAPNVLLEPQTGVAGSKDFEAVDRRDLILAFGSIFTARQPANIDMATAAKWLQHEAETTDKAEIRAACQWCLRQLGEELVSPSKAPSSNELNAARNWELNSLGMTMVTVKLPVKVVVGSPSWAPHRSLTEMQHERSTHGPVAISAMEVGRGDFNRFLEDPRVVKIFSRERPFSSALDQPESPDLPQTRVNHFNALRFCQWLSELEGVPESDWCFPGIWEVRLDGQTPVTFEPPSDYLRRRGYRLPTDAEWEFACRAGSSHSRHFGDSDALVGAYAWHVDNSQGRIHPRGRLQPNELGFFDLLGNAREWCQEDYVPWNQAMDRIGAARPISGKRTLRGGSFASPVEEVRSPQFQAVDPATLSPTVGFRVARTTGDHGSSEGSQD